MAIELGKYLALSAVIFGLGAIGFLVRRNVLIQLMSIELMLNSVNLMFVAFNRYLPDNHFGSDLIFVIAVAVLRLPWLAIVSAVPLKIPLIDAAYFEA